MNTRALAATYGVTLACLVAPGALRAQEAALQRPELPVHRNELIRVENHEDDRTAIRELFRVLAPGGVALVSVPADPERWDASDDWAGHVRRYAPETLAKRFEEAGFTVVRCFRWGFPLVGLYHRHVYLPMLSRKRGPSGPMPAWKRLASGLLAYAFRLDRLFDDHAGGLGLVLLARKPG